MRKVQGIIAGLICALAAPCAGPCTAVAAQSPGVQHVQVALIAEKATVRPGETITVALRQTIAPGWHTYWVNPGDAGEATTLDWKLPEGAAAGAIRWPVPHVINIGPLVDYGYSGEVLLLADITLPQTLTGASIDIAAEAKWLVCKEICVPEEAEVRLSLPLLVEGLSPRPSPNAPLIAAARGRLPEAAPWPVRFEAGKSMLMLTVDKFAATKPSGEIRFFPLHPDIISNPAPQKVTFADGNLVLRMRRGEQAAMPETFAGILAVETPDASGQVQQRGYSVSGPVTPSANADAEEMSFGLALVFAFLGGLVLNLMPCVFPVLSLKALSLARERALHERHIHGAAYLAGVLASCVLAGVLLIAVRATGVSIGWGMQFQSPAFVLILMAMFLALGLNMSGVFSVGGRLAGVGDSLTHVPGLTGYFFTGALATIVATPCIAPYMGAAVFYAFTQPGPQLLAVLVALGIGFALPMVLLSVSPAMGRWLPKPGAWMQTFKELMAFPLYATAGWLLWVLSRQQGSDGVLAGVLALMGVAFAAWLAGSVREPGRWRSGAAVLVVLGTIVAGLSSFAGPKFETFSLARLEELRAQDKPVFINLTAAWCLTCLVNEHVALRSDRIAAEFAERGIVYLKGDWTKRDPEITAFLRSFDRAGVPLYVLYAGKGEPLVLPQFLTERIVMDGIESLPRQQAKSE